MDMLFSIILGIGLAACCGFRVFAPVLALAIAARAGAVHLDPSMAWLASDVALLALGAAAVLEIGAYFIPWLDNALDVAATPSAVIAGTLVAASQFSFASSASGDLMKWSLALIAGGGAAAAVQAATVAVRATSTALTGGIANPLVGAVESGAAVVGSIAAIVVPLAVVGLLLGVTLVMVWWVRRRRAARPQPVMLSPRGSAGLAAQTA